MRYVDAFVLMVPRSKLSAYKKLASQGGKLWKKYGALEYMETIGDDLYPTMGGMTALTFPKLLKLKRNEVPIFSFIVYKSRAHRDRVNAKVLKDPRIAEACDPKALPFDCKRMAYGGFEVIAEMENLLNKKHPRFIRGCFFDQFPTSDVGKWSNMKYIKTVPRCRSCFFCDEISYSINVSALPFLDPRPVRPMRWT